MLELFNKKINMLNFKIQKRYIALYLIFCLLSCSAIDGDTITNKQYRFRESIITDGLQRTYTLNLPPNYYESENIPLVIALHGLGGDAVQIERDYGLTNKANQSGYAIVYPEGIIKPGIFGIRTWNAGNCCDYAQNSNINDVKFIKTLIDLLLLEFNFDDKRVFVTGMSNGAMLAYRLACEIPDKIAAIAPVSGIQVINECNPNNPIPILHIHSQLDDIVPYQGGYGLAEYEFPSVNSVLEKWSLLHNCDSSSPTFSKDYNNYQYKKWECNNAVVIEYYLTKDGGHSWPMGLKPRLGSDDPSAAINATNKIWEFFNKY